ncbi:hypothetical protein CA51_48840 [Rosistilla oblonga]|nr:hypothetical protein CA51_48840 [Rosistilla oblonga]
MHSLHGFRFLRLAPQALCDRHYRGFVHAFTSRLALSCGSCHRLYAAAASAASCTHSLHGSRFLWLAPCQLYASRRERRKQGAKGTGTFLARLARAEGPAICIAQPAGLGISRRRPVSFHNRRRGNVPGWGGTIDRAYSPTMSIMSIIAARTQADGLGYANGRACGPDSDEYDVERSATNERLPTGLASVRSR